MLFDLIFELMICYVLMEDFGQNGDVIICVVILVDIVYDVWINVCEYGVVLGMQVVEIVFCLVDVLLDVEILIVDGQLC